jgi:hypothetical protein
MSWFEVDRDGLRQLLEGRDKSFVVRELVQNAWDEPGVTRCDVTLEPIPGRPAARLVVEDDAPEGFYDLRHAYTLYARTRKRPDPSKRGRFNLGEKQVLALCRNARIVTTTGGVRFDADGKRHAIREKRPAGSVFEAELNLTRAEIEDALRAARTFIPPASIATTVNGEALPAREPLAVVEATLATEFEDGEGRYRTTRRKTEVHVYEPLPGERALLFEIGLPVIETGDRWSYDVQQRVPLTADRDNVKPSFLQDVRAEVANAMAAQLTEDDASERWVRDATADPRIAPEATRRIADLRWGERRAIVAPGDSHGRERAIAAGFHVVAPSEMSRGEWEQFRRAEAVPSATSLFPRLTVAARLVPGPQWTEDQRRVAELAKRIARLTLGIRIKVHIIDAPEATTRADYDRDERLLRLNAAHLSDAWFAGPREDVIDLIAHEVAHHEGGHVDESYYRCLSRMAAKLALMEPGVVLGE